MRTQKPPIKPRLGVNTLVKQLKSHLNERTKLLDEVRMGVEPREIRSRIANHESKLLDIASTLHEHADLITWMKKQKKKTIYTKKDSELLHSMADQLMDYHERDMQCLFKVREFHPFDFDRMITENYENRRRLNGQIERRLR